MSPSMSDPSLVLQLCSACHLDRDSAPTCLLLLASGCPKHAMTGGTETNQSHTTVWSCKARRLTGSVFSAGGENGFNQAIELSADALANVKFVQVRTFIAVLG